MITYPNVKVNLGLHVIRKREDGFHDLETLFVPCNEVHDTLEIIKADDYSRTSSSLAARYGSLAQAVRPDGKLMINIARKEGVDWDPLMDLTAKAYGILDDDFNLPSVKIYLEKTSPVGAGLGGGSSDAAFALKMLSDLFALELSDDQLAGYASRLGSDCAFFIYNRPMFGEGRGEILSDFLIDMSEYDLKLVVPEGIAVSTKEAYSGIVPREAVPSLHHTSLKSVLSLDIPEWKNALVNDFEKTVFEAHPELAAIKRSLYDSGAVYASMSGSGSALFALYKK